jgi:hypothetical protein
VSLTQKLALSAERHKCRELGKSCEALSTSSTVTTP